MNRNEIRDKIAELKARLPMLAHSDSDALAKALHQIAVLERRLGEGSSRSRESRRTALASTEIDENAEGVPEVGGDDETQEERVLH